MLKGVKEWLRGLFTGADNLTPDPARHGWAFSMLALTGAAFVQTYKGISVDLTALAAAYGIIGAAGAGGTVATDKSQPHPKDQDQE